VVQVTVFILLSDDYGILRVLTIRTMTAMISTAPIAITAQSSAGGIVPVPVPVLVNVKVVIGWVMVITVEVGCGRVMVLLAVVVGVVTAAAVVKK
jgi:hypothetical protein